MSLQRQPPIPYWMAGTILNMMLMLKMQISAAGTSQMPTNCGSVHITTLILEANITWFRVTGTQGQSLALFIYKYKWTGPLEQ
jgi:hypothetical protein